MKKSLLFLAGLMLSTMSLFAERTKPSVTYTSFADAVSSGAEVYLYNVEYGAFLTGGNYWGTRASVVYSNGSGNGSNYVSYEGLKEGKGEISGFRWVIAQTEETTEDGDPCYSFANKTTVNYLTADAWDGIWVDGSSEDKRPYNFWYVKELESNTFELYYDGMVGKFGLSEYAYGEQYQTCTFFLDESQTYKSDEEDGVPVFKGTPYTTWAVVSAEEYARVQPLIAAYYKAFQLESALADAKQEYPSLDFSAAEAVAANDNASLEEIEKAIAGIQTAISDYFSSLASFDKPYSYEIGDGSDIAPWTFDGSGTWHTNTWSVEANGGADGTDMVVPFCEYWIASGGTLADAIIHQTLKGAAPGLYKFTADVRLYNEAGTATELSGCRMYFGDDNSINLEDEVEMYTSGGKQVLWYKHNFNIIAIVKEAGDIDFGFDIKSPKFNWMAFKNTSLNYYGNKDVEANAIKLYKSCFAFEPAEEGLRANPDLVKAYNEAVPAVEAATTMEAIKAAADAADAAEVALEANVKAYTNLFNKFEEWDDNVTKGEGLEGAEWDAYCDYLLDDPDIAEGYPTPAPVTIKNGDYSLTTEEIENYIKTVDELYAHAVATSLTEGADCTSMLQNADFGSSTGSLDAEGNPVLGTYNTNGWTGDAVLGGLYNYMTAERFNTTIDFYQVVKDAPAGLYKIETHAFVRPGGNGEFDGTESTNTYLYMNNFRSQVGNIVADALPVEEAENGVNCYIDADAKVKDGTFYPADTWTEGYDYNGSTNGYEWGYIPNCMVGAATAFQAGRYSVVTYGLVGEGEDMKVGITSDGKKVADADNSWFLFSGFKLTFMGKNAEAIMGVLPDKVEELQAALTENKDNMTSPSTDAAEAAIEATKGLTASSDKEKLWTALQGVVDAIADVRTNVEAGEAYAEALVALEAAVEELSAFDGYDETEAYKAYAAIEDEVDGYIELNTEALTALVEKMKEVTTALEVAQAQFGSEDDPIDLTGVIVNPDFETGNTTGWTLNYAEGNYTNLKYESASYTNNDDEVTISHFVNAWKNGAALGDGKIFQEIATILPAGTYRLEADIIATNQNAEKVLDEEGEEDTEATAAAKKDVQGFYLYIAEEDAATMVTPVATGDGAPEHFTVTIVKASDTSKLTVGVKSYQTNGNWLAADNFQLFSLGSDIPDAINSINVAAQKANGKYLENGRIVIIKNGVKYNVAGQAIK